MLINGFLEIPACLLVLLFLKSIGRRTLMSGIFFVSAITLCSSLLFEAGKICILELPCDSNMPKDLVSRVSHVPCIAMLGGDRIYHGHGIHCGVCVRFGNPSDYSALLWDWRGYVSGERRSCLWTVHGKRAGKQNTKMAKNAEK